MRIPSINQMPIHKTSLKVMGPLKSTDDRAISFEQLRSLAKDFSSGISHKEVTRRFVDAVNLPLKDRLSAKDYQSLVDQITEFLLSDQQFIDDFFKNLKDINAKRPDLARLKLLQMDMEGSQRRF